MISLWGKYKLTKTIFTLGVVAFLLMGVFGLSHAGMTMDADGHMTMDTCPFMSGMGICTMSPLEHVAMWQSMFTSTSHELNQILVVLVLMISVLGIAWIRYVFPPPRELVRQRTYYSYREHVPVITVLQELFSSGILNPKLF